MDIVKAVCIVVLIGWVIGLSLAVPLGRMLARARLRDTRPIVEVPAGEDRQSLPQVTLDQGTP